MCARSATRCSSSDETGPASSCVLHCLTPGTAGRHPCHWSLECLDPSMALPCQRTLALVLLLPGLGWTDQPSLPCTSWVAVVEHCPRLCPHPCSCSKPWVLSGTCCALPRACPGPLAWLSDGRAILPTRGPAFTSWVGQNNLRALSLPFPALCYK